MGNNIFRSLRRRRKVTEEKWIKTLTRLESNKALSVQDDIKIFSTLKILKLPLKIAKKMLRLTMALLTGLVGADW